MGQKIPSRRNRAWKYILRLLSGTTGKCSCCANQKVDFFLWKHEVNIPRKTDLKFMATVWSLQELQYASTDQWLKIAQKSPGDVGRDQGCSCGHTWKVGYIPSKGRNPTLPHILLDLWDIFIWVTKEEQYRNFQSWNQQSFTDNLLCTTYIIWVLSCFR